MQLISERLRRRTAKDGADPLVTYYDLGTGERTELAEERETTQRRLLRPSTPWATARDGVVAALIGGGSVVVAVGDDGAALERIRETENIDGEVG